MSAKKKIIAGCTEINLSILFTLSLPRAMIYCNFSQKLIAEKYNTFHNKQYIEYLIKYMITYTKNELNSLNFLANFQLN